MKRLLFKCLATTSMLAFFLSAGSVDFARLLPGIRELHIGQTIHLRNLSITLHGVRPSKGTSKKKAIPGEIYYIMDITVKNESDKTIWVYEKNDFLMKDATGYKYENEYLSSCTGDLQTKVFKGDMVRGELAFQVPGNSKGLKLYFDFNGFGYDFVVAWDIPTQDLSKRVINFEKEGPARPKSAFKELFYVKNKLNAAINREVYESLAYKITSLDKKIIEEGTLIDSKHEGFWKRYYPLNQILVEGVAKEGVLKKSFLKEYYTENSLKLEVPCVKEKRHGVLTKYYTNKSVEAVVKMKYGVKNGKCTFYFPSGNVKAEVDFINNKADGEMKLYGENGAVKKAINFKLGLVLDAFNYDKSGATTAIKPFDLEKDEAYPLLIQFEY